MNVEFDFDNRGETSIQIRHLTERFSSGPYRSENDLRKKFGILEYLERKDVKMPNLKIFPIMDTDDSPYEEKSYRTGNLFSSSIFKDRIIPIFNTPNLDSVLNECGFRIDPNNKIGSYYALVGKYELRDLIDALKDCKNTNLPIFLRYCASVTPSYQDSV
ncbi:MAG: hypothetical protein LBH69_02530 [Methanomassiliicoccaceae archaeon]|nr:hypothetical protein [Methanomassiliicoccaceae archaeon]